MTGRYGGIEKVTDRRVGDNMSERDNQCDGDYTTPPGRMNSSIIPQVTDHTDEREK
jgi:hypothetical protein